MPDADWDAYVQQRFPGFLLPDSCRSRLDPVLAQRFLSALTGREDQLLTLCCASLVAARREWIEEWAVHRLPELARNLPSRTATHRQHWRGGFQGRLDVPATLGLRTSGDLASYVTRQRHRLFDLPENILAKAVAMRLLTVLETLRRAGITAERGWSQGLAEAEGALRDTLLRTRFEYVPIAALTDVHRGAARSARHRAYHLAFLLERGLREILDEPDDLEIARIVAEGALVAVGPSRRFELAVLLALVDAAWDTLRGRAGEMWTYEPSLVVQGRDEVVVFREAGGREIGVHFDQAVLPEGPRDRGVTRYLGHNGRLRPDITVVRRRNGAETGACPIEVKCSADPSYLGIGLGEAHLYAREYEPLTLHGWPSAILVISDRCHTPPRRDDSVIAVDWKSWPPPDVLGGLLQY